MAALGHDGPVLGIVGWKNNGKTTLVVRLVEWLTAQGYRVSTVKHAHHTVDIDQPGRDSWRHRQAGATEAVLATSRRFAVVHELRDEAEPALEDLLARMAPVDLVVVEGFKRFGHPKIEVHRRERGTALIAPEDPSVIAVATDHPALDTDRPLLPLDNVEAIARFALGRLGLRPPA
jgi:molybdopterin-guanine dinucleotide biosynthesis protein MobB